MSYAQRKEIGGNITLAIILVGGIQFALCYAIVTGLAYNVIKKFGNYGEIFDRDLGKDSPYKMDRDLTNLWNKGGIQYAPPIR